MPRENPWSFWPRFAWETVGKHAALAGTIVRLVAVANAISRNAAAKDYMDQALTPVGEDGDETLDLFTKTTGGGAAVDHIKKVARLTARRQGRLTEPPFSAANPARSPFERKHASFRGPRSNPFLVGRELWQPIPVIPARLASNIPHFLGPKAERMGRAVRVKAGEAGSHRAKHPARRNPHRLPAFSSIAMASSSRTGYNAAIPSIEELFGMTALSRMNEPELGGLAACARPMPRCST